MLAINMDDVLGVLQTISSHLIAIGIALIVAILVIVAVKKLPKALKRLVRGEACLALVLVILIVVNLICTGPMTTLLNSSFGVPASTLSDETVDEAYALVEDISDEGIVLLENQDSALPLANTSVNVFGWSAVNPCYGGTGSGALNKDYDYVTFLQGLENAGISYNTQLIDFYNEYTTSYQEANEDYKGVMLPNVGMWAQDWTLPQPSADAYSDELMAGAKEFSDTAVIFISRVGGEGADLPTDMSAIINGEVAAQSYNEDVNEGPDWDEGDHYLQLTNQEEAMVDLVCQNFNNVVLVYNGANPFELGFVENYDQIKGVVWCAGTGQAGFNSLGNILTGAVNPSGKLVDTYVYDMTSSPSWNNFGNFVYDNMDEFANISYTNADGTNYSTETTPTFVNYVEGIYVGYKYYTTAAAEGLIDYDATVQYSFGYGLSYTNFTQELTNVTNDGTTVTMEVTVTNTGNVPGKEVVEAYYNPPYTNGGIEKASANLVAYDKTDLLEPNASQVVTLTFDLEDMASYDTYGSGCYVLEQGDYVISINSDANTIIDSQTVTVDNTVVYDENNPRSTDQVAAVNQFGYAEGDVTYLSRADHFANYAEATAAPASYSMSDEYKATFYNIGNYITAENTAADEDPNAEYPTTGAENGVKLVDLRGLEYDDPKWDDLLDQLTLEEMTDLIALGGYQTAAIESIDKYRTNDCDGPGSINNNFTHVGSVGFPAAVQIAATWNTDLALQFGECIGKMASEMDTSGWYAPAMNIHRSAFAGRNFEYYSEDSVISGTMAANAVIGAEEYGVYAYIKHYALNDQETNRCNMLCTWSNEQAIREIYLKPFEMAVKDGGAKAVMSSFNYVGNRWAGGSNALCNTVLRDEWGFQGMVLTDYFGIYGYMNADQGIRNGTDFMLVNYPTATGPVQFQETAGAQQAMRTATHNILYVVVNSRAYTDEGIALATQPTQWETVLTGVNIGVGVVLVAWEVLLIVNFLKRKKSAQVD